FYFKGVVYLISKRHWLVIGLYIVMLLLSALIPVVLFFGFHFHPLNAAIYTNIVVFVIGVFVVLAIMRTDFSEERRSYPLSILRGVAWTLLGIFLAWIAQIVAISIEMNILGIDPGSEN